MQNRAKNRKYHYIYKITRFDGKFYIGMHSTDNLEDGYFGGGTYLAKSKRKHGLDKHTMEILEFLPSREELVKREKELITKECIEDTLCMNISLGGHGSWFYASKFGNEKQKVLRHTDPAWVESRNKNVSAGMQKFMANGGVNGFKYKKHSAESKEKISEGNRGVRMYVDENMIDQPPIEILNKCHKFKVGQQPLGWILFEDWKNIKKFGSILQENEIVEYYSTKSKWITNGKISAKIDVKYKIPDGWVAGKIIKKFD